MPESISLKIVVVLMVGFSLASIFGYICHRIKLSPILGYLIAGYLIGPYSPGYVADIVVSEQLGEIGVVLMMFGVGLHFKWQNLFKFKRIAIPGAIGQTFVTALIGSLLSMGMGCSLVSGLVFGIAIGVASTIILVRLLDEHHILTTPKGHICVSWLIAEDIISVLFLLLLPTFAVLMQGGAVSFQNISLTILLSLFKFLLLCVFMFTVGKRIISFLLSKVENARSHELFNLAVLGLTFVIAVLAAKVFGTSIALGAFIAGLTIHQTKMRHKIAEKVETLTDLFVAFFFISIGMLFNPQAVINHYLLFIGVLIVILVFKPAAAFLITVGLKYPVKTALTIGLALAQIGEFSFILSEEAMRFNIIPETAYDIIVACSIVSIAINAFLFKLKPVSRAILDLK